MKLGTGSLMSRRPTSLSVVVAVVLVAMCTLPLVAAAQHRHTTGTPHRRMLQDTEIDEVTDDGGEQYIDVSDMFELNLTETPEYKAAYAAYPYPLNMADMESALKELVDECSANITGPQFCDTCVRPIARLEVSNYYTHMMNDNIPDNLTTPQQHAIFDRAGEQIMERLESYGVPMDGFFYANVIFCSLHEADTACILTPGDLHARVDPILQQCKAVQFSMGLHQNQWHRVNSNITTQSALTTHFKINPAPEADKALEEAIVKEYCLGCYWPFVDTMVNDALSDKFWCTNRGILNGTVTDLLEADDEFGPSAANVTETALVDVLHTDVSFVACMENARAIFLNEKVDPFDADLTDEIRDKCWLDGYKPTGNVLTAETHARVLALPCD